MRIDIVVGKRNSVNTTADLAKCRPLFVFSPSDAISVPELNVIVDVVTVSAKNTCSTNSNLGYSNLRHDVRFPSLEISLQDQISPKRIRERYDVTSRLVLTIDHTYYSKLNHLAEQINNRQILQ
jgi:hypothetical protein